MRRSFEKLTKSLRSCLPSILLRELRVKKDLFKLTLNCADLGKILPKNHQQFSINKNKIK